ncbi:hypothetical protein [Streptomyces sp. ME18-1-4]|uniref:hypothetical protein n=1 Tax=Streptomyces sp. ME18-1-4 TaxID=3028685 RepID=UPI0029B33D1E|nr:hypothetical protein [Streptomyces sp. ME18-1-4]MDX3241319.1 hypothetical protein [Streptomyces sp. ME18-1-4]
MNGRQEHRLGATIEAEGALDLAYTDTTPIATCHWQLIANVLALRGHPGYWERLGLAWGVRWRGGAVLFGSMTWNDVLAEATGMVVSIQTFATAEAARARELDLSARGVPFLTEVDAFHLPAPASGGESGSRHVVHAVLVVERGPEWVRIVDVNLGRHVMALPAPSYERMRSAPCEGRAEPYKLYALLRDPDRSGSPAQLLTLVRAQLRSTHERSQQALRAYTAWARESDAPIDVCRVAGERYQASRFFEYLHAHGVRAAGSMAGCFTDLTDAWYMLHMLAEHEGSARSSHRGRLIRMLQHLAEKESSAAETVLG